MVVFVFFIHPLPVAATFCSDEGGTCVLQTSTCTGVYCDCTAAGAFGCATNKKCCFDCTCSAPTATPVPTATTAPTPTPTIGVCTLGSNGHCNGTVANGCKFGIVKQSCGYPPAGCSSLENSLLADVCQILRVPGAYCGFTTSCQVQPTVTPNPQCASSCDQSNRFCSTDNFYDVCGGGSCPVTNKRVGSIYCACYGDCPAGSAPVAGSCTHCGEICASDLSCTAPTPTGGPTNTPGGPTPTPTPTPASWIRVVVKNSSLVNVPVTGICKIYCTNTVCTKSGTPVCSTNDADYTFPKGTSSATYPDRGGWMSLVSQSGSPLVVVGTTPSVAGRAESTCNGLAAGGSCYVWPWSSWTTGGRTVTFIVATPTPTPTSTPTPTPGPWIKLKNSSFLSRNSLTSQIPLTPVAYDAYDTTQAYFIIGAVGVVGAPAINITTLNPSARTGNPEYKAAYSPTYLLTPNSYLSYIKTRKQHTVITSLSEITGSGIYVYNGALSINSNSYPFNQPYNIVLISTGTVTVTVPGVIFAPAGSVAIVSSTINFNAVITEANGIFIADNISTGNTTNKGLKIIGNLVAQTSLINGREWTDDNMPSLFIVFDSQKYLDLLPYLSTANYEWRQTQ